MNGCETKPGVYRIGLAHGSVTGFGNSDDTNALLDPARATSAQLDYLALGDWHGAVRVDARTWYSGTPEPDRFSDNESGHALVVEIGSPGAIPKVEKVRAAQFSWVALSEELTNADHLDGLRSRLDDQFSDGPVRALVRLTLSGGLSVSDLARVKAWCEVLDAEVAYMAVRDDGLKVRGDLSGHSAFSANPELMAAAEVLRQMEGIDGTGAENGADSARPRQAQVGLQLLFDAVETALEEEAA